ncbi:MAG: TAXI family TRAP transporter solute-binding subunit [Pseudomonadota bacterium]
MRLKDRVACLFSVLALICGGASAQTTEPVGTEVATANHTPVIASGVMAGVYYPVANILSDAAGGGFEVLPTTGSMENLVRLASGEVDFAIALSDRVEQAIDGSTPFDQAGLGEDLRLVMALFAEPLTILVRANDEIQSLSDLADRTVNLGTQGNPVEHLFRMTLDASGLVHEEEDYRYIPLSEQAQALCDGEVDAIGYIAVHPSGTVYQATTLCDVRILPIDGDAAETLLAGDPTLAPARIQASLYLGTGGWVDSVGPMALLMTRSDVSPMYIDRLVNGVLGDPAAVERRHPALTAIDQRLRYAEDGPAPLHDRAAELLGNAATQ